jgi:hypothetical protein
MRALIVISLCTFSTIMTDLALAKQKFQLSKCTHYSECIQDAGPYCQSYAAGEPTAQRAAVHADCLALYQSACREIHCD